MNRSQRGFAAESAAARFLEDFGYKILERNFRTKLGEVDLIAQDGDTVVFVEVRFRANDDFGPATASVDRRKRRKIIKAARLYAQSRSLDCPMRFDVMGFEGPQVTHLPGAFDAEGRA